MLSLIKLISSSNIVSAVVFILLVCYVICLLKVLDYTKLPLKTQHNDWIVIRTTL